MTDMELLTKFAAEYPSLTLRLERAHDSGQWWFYICADTNEGSGPTLAAGHSVDPRIAVQAAITSAIGKGCLPAKG